MLQYSKLQNCNLIQLKINENSYITNVPVQRIILQLFNKHLRINFVVQMNERLYRLKWYCGKAKVQ